MEEGDSAFWAGYRDCGEQAIHFLLESGTVSENDPLIQGLRTHLREKAHQLSLANGTMDNTQQYPHSTISGFSFHNPEAVSMTQSTSMTTENRQKQHTDVNLNGSHERMDLEQSMDEGYDSSINTSVSDTSIDLSLDLTTSVSRDLSLDLSSPGNVKEIPPVATPNVSSTPRSRQMAHTVTVDTFTPIMHHQVTCPVTCSNPPISCSVNPPQFRTSDSQFMPSYSVNASQSHMISDVMALPQDLRSVDPFRDPVGLALLAQNNPEIASVAQELFELLSEGCEDELLEDSDSEDMYEDVESLEGDTVESVLNEDVSVECANSNSDNRTSERNETSGVFGVVVNVSDTIENIVSGDDLELCTGENKENNCTQRSLSSPSKQTERSLSPRNLSPLQVKSNN